MSEADMAARVVAWLEADGWEVYQEVEPIGLWGPGRADIVAVRDCMTRVVECKRVLSFELLAQAEHWIRYAHWVDIAVPSIKPSAEQSAGRNTAYRCAEMLGLGVLRVKSLWPVEEQAGTPAVVRIGEDRTPGEPGRQLLDLLRPEHKTHAKAGEPGGGQWTRWKGTCAAVASYAEQHPGCTLRDALSRVDHHYSSLRSGVSSLESAAARGVSVGFVLRVEDNITRVYPKVTA